MPALLVIAAILFAAVGLHYLAALALIAACIMAL